jgi:hypothetical protein
MQMKKESVKLGSTYAAKVNGQIVPVRLEKANPHGGWDGVNLNTRKGVRIRGSQRLRGLWPKKTMTTCRPYPCSRLWFRSGHKPPLPSQPVRSIPERDPGFNYEVDPDFLEHTSREQIDQPELPWEP